MQTVFERKMEKRRHSSRGVLLKPKRDNVTVGVILFKGSSVYWATPFVE